MYCSSCGLALSSDANFCASCGQKVPPASAPVLGDEFQPVISSAPSASSEALRPMSFWEVILSPNGRIGRIQHLICWLMFLVLEVLLIYALVVFAPSTSADSALKILLIIFLWPSVAILVKRLHDRGRSAVFGLILFIPIVGLWVVIEAFFLPGTKGPNEYGPAAGMVRA